MKTRHAYVVQTRPARGTPEQRKWGALDGVKPFKRHKDALDVAKTLTNVPDNRGHDRYYRVRPQPAPATESR